MNTNESLKNQENNQNNDSRNQNQRNQNNYHYRNNQNNNNYHQRNQRPNYNNYNNQRSYQKSRANQKYENNDRREENEDISNDSKQIEKDTQVSKDQKNKIYNRRKLISHSENQEKENVVNCICCLHELFTFVYYSCSHYVCLNCAVKMRVLCEKIDCPVCRQESKKVFCTKNLIESKNFDLSLKIKSNVPERDKAGIFIDPEYAELIEKEHDEILSNRCDICPSTTPPFNTFQDLDYHIRKFHRRFFCELCMDNLKLFPYERKHYTREELATHKRNGDKDDYSFKGHPLCEYCDQRFFDRDEIYRHFRRDHYFCHFCDTDGIEEYYKDYNQLRTHFLKSHYLCELDSCSANAAQTHEYVVFRTELDFQAHKKQKHAKTKSEQKNYGRLNIEFSLTNSARDRYRRQANRRRDNSSEDEYRPITRPESRITVSEIDPNILRESERQFELDETTRRQKENIQKLKEQYERHSENRSQLVDQTLNEPEATVSSAETPQAASSTSWKNVISSGPVPKLNKEAEFPSLAGDQTTKSKLFSLADLGASISTASTPWNKKVTKPEMKIELAKPSKKQPVPPPEFTEPIVQPKPEVSTSQKKSKKKKDKIMQNEDIESKPQIIDSNIVEQSTSVSNSNFVSPPPGFTTKTTLPPPGFEKVQTEEKKENNSIASFIKPDNYEQRNLDLKSSLFMLFGHYNQDEFEKFKQLSNDFRNGLINADDYMLQCQKLLSLSLSPDAYKNNRNSENKILHAKLFDLIQEMLVLLPNVDKQNELANTLNNLLDKFSICDNEKNKSPNNNNKKWNNKAGNEVDMFSKKITKCQFCNQFFKKIEINFHQIEYHSKEFSSQEPLEEFPVLIKEKEPSNASGNKWLSKPDNGNRKQVEDLSKLDLNKNKSNIVVEDFPTLGTSLVNKSSKNTKNIVDDFPVLGSGPVKNTNLLWNVQPQQKQTVNVETKPKAENLEEAFPALQSNIMLSQDNRFSALPTQSLFQNPSSHLSILNKKKHRLQK
ncbi:unnamed protein product [Brachionus calyciflorus]|uniref:RING-type domain-containing protein n=1 Tax=Brachionus calyciflorus TaxID=104777 RepID=A0A813ZRW4_9BILA|nr:unnamed protein product [Brachionus calyciflorus]